MLQLEDQCYMMGPLIDQQLQKIDYKHAVLDDLNMKLIEAFQMYNNLMKESITKTTVSFGAQQPPLPMANNFNPNMQAVNINQGFIPFVAAPPQTDANPYNLANQLNNFANYNIPPSDQQQQPAVTAPVANFQNYPSQNMYQQYGQQMGPQIDANTQNMMPNMVNLSAAQQHQFGTMPNQ